MHVSVLEPGATQEQPKSQAEIKSIYTKASKPPASPHPCTFPQSHIDRIKTNDIDSLSIDRIISEDVESQNVSQVTTNDTEVSEVVNDAPKVNGHASGHDVKENVLLLKPKDPQDNELSRIPTFSPLPTPVNGKKQTIPEPLPSRGRTPIPRSALHQEASNESSVASIKTTSTTKQKKKSSAVVASLKATQVEYRRLGKSGLHVSVPILGTMGMGSPEWQDWVLDETAALPILKEAFDVGLNTWDTANVYSNGVSEEIIGKALKTFAIPRSRVVLMTKCNGYVGQDPSDMTIPYKSELRRAKDYVNQGGLSRGAIFDQVDASLARLGTSYIDLLQVHRFDEKTPIEETMQALNDLVRLGKVRYIGASSMWCYQFAMMQCCAEKNGWTKFVSMQNHYNLLYREEEREMNKYCKATGVGIIPWSPLCRGHLARPPTEFGNTSRSQAEAEMQEIGFFNVGRSPEDAAIVERVQEIAQRRGWKMSQVALAWLSQQNVSSYIVGVNTADRLQEVVQAAGKDLTPEERKYLEELYVPRTVQGH